VSGLFDLSGKVALITGGAQGLGRLIAHGMLDAGARVYITSRRAEPCEQAARELSVDGHCIGIQADVATTAGVVALSTELKTRESRLDILVNNAGKTWGAPLESFPDQAWSRVMSVNVQGPFTLIKELLPLLKAAASAADPARIINIGSIAGTVVEPLQAYSYAASKAAIHHLSRVLAALLAA
jgi:NAD(P)-dependent dehydrogenase (short-subunit alcohol dehydrogenase family)